MLSQCRRVHSLALFGALGLVGCATQNGGLTAPPLVIRSATPAGWTASLLPGHASGVHLLALQRPARVPPARYRVVVVPGSGCTGWSPVAERYFAGLLHAEVLVLHKPGALPQAGLGASCSPDFLLTDTLSHWRDAARTALRAHGWASTETAANLPMLLVGISEGAELLPDLAMVYPHVAGLVMVSAPGLDPVDAGRFQAQRLGQSTAWQQLQLAQASDRADDTEVQGRTLGYWRAFWSWPLAKPLLEGSWPILRVWGDADEAVALQAYLQFSTQAQERVAPWCDIRLTGADHALQSPQRDGMQWLWARLENWARQPNTPLCESVSLP